MRNDHEPHATIFGYAVALAVVIPAGIWLKSKSEGMPALAFFVLCVGIVAVILLIARRMDKREADRSLKAAERLRRNGLDLSPSEYRSQSLPGKQE